MSDRWLDYLPLAELRPDPRNPKRHDLDVLEASVDRFGFTEPIMIDERTGLLVAGHGRTATLTAAHAAGQVAPEGVEDRDGEWWVPVLRGWSSANDDEAFAYLVASNRLRELGGWNLKALAELLDRVNTGPGLAGTGYTPASLDELLVGISSTDAMTDAVARERSIGERRDAYAAKSTRSLVLDYEASEYERVRELATAQRIAGGHHDAAALFRALVAP